MVAEEGGHMLFARSDELVVIEWVDSKTVHLTSTKLAFKADCELLPYT